MNKLPVSCVGALIALVGAGRMFKLMDFQDCVVYLLVAVVLALVNISFVLEKRK